jgi:hypothetical protein
MAGELKAVEIFGVGTWHGSRKTTVTEAMLDEMVANFETINRVPGYTPLLKLGHEDTQKYFGQRKGAPNLGFVAKLWRDGKKLLADFTNVPDALLELIRNRRYNSLSIEMYPQIEHDGKKFSNVLTAVSLLGAELPAVKGLKELAASLFADTFEIEGERVTLQQEIGMFTKEQADALVAAAVTAAVEQTKASFEEEKKQLIAAKEAAEAAAKDANEKCLAAYASVAAAEEKAFVQEANAVIDGAIKEGKMVPAQKASALAFLFNMGRSVKFADKDQSPTAIFKAFIDQMPKVVKYGEEGASRSSRDGSVTAAQEVDEKAKAAMAGDKTGKLTYADALQAVLAADPDLKARYAAQAAG